MWCGAFSRSARQNKNKQKIGQICGHSQARSGNTLQFPVNKFTETQEDEFARVPTKQLGPLLATAALQSSLTGAPKQSSTLRFSVTLTQPRLVTVKRNRTQLVAPHCWPVAAPPWHGNASPTVAVKPIPFHSAPITANMPVSSFSIPTAYKIALKTRISKNRS